VRTSPLRLEDSKTERRILQTIAVSCKLLAVSVLLLSASCELNPEPDFTPVINVHALLNPEWESPQDNRVFVNRTYRMTEPPDSLLWDADVRIWRGADTWQLSAARLDSVWSYFPDRGITAEPFDTFSLLVAKPGFDTVRGTTLVPDTFSLLDPLPGDTITVQDSLIWTRSRHSAGYYLSLRQQFQGQEFDVSGVVPNESIPGLPYDTLVARLPLYFLSQQPQGPFTLRLMALDTNYYEYVRGSQFQGGQSDSRLAGGIGVFGSGVERSVEVYLKQDTAGFCLDPGTRSVGRPRPALESWNLYLQQHVVEPGFRPVRVPGDE
jgi:hypothetical protein